jgi:hypothetical protein
VYIIVRCVREKNHYDIMMVFVRDNVKESLEEEGDTVRYPNKHTIPHKDRGIVCLT